MTRFRPIVSRITGYVPGEQPQDGGWIKLNTNENPYPPSPRVREAIAAAARGRLNVYPDPLATPLREAIGRAYGVDPDWVLPGNGSDEVLTIIMRTFVEPGEIVALPYPSYVLYETLADLQGARSRRITLNPDWSWNIPAASRPLRNCRVLFVPNPNSPSGTLWPRDVLEHLLPPHGVLVIDQAYADFCDAPAGLPMLDSSHRKRVILTRTLSKSYSLAGIRCGFAIADPDLIAGMRKVKDSYNCNALTIAAAIAALEDGQWMQANARRIGATRLRLRGALLRLGFDVPDSQANFVWATHPHHAARRLYEALKQRRILVRYMRFPGALTPQGGCGTLEGLRITIGTDDQIDALLAALSELV